MEAIWYGVMASLTFIGFVSLIFLVLLTIYKPSGYGKYIIILSDDADRQKTENVLFGAHIRNLLFGNLICDEITVVDNGLSDTVRSAAEAFADEYSNINFCSAEELCDKLLRKKQDGN